MVREYRRVMIIARRGQVNIILMGHFNTIFFQKSGPANKQYTCICIFLYLFCWGGHYCPIHCDLFRSFVLPRIWVLLGREYANYAQRTIFSDLRFFNEPEISDSGPPAQSPSRRTCAQDFYFLKNIHRPQPGLNPQTLALEASTPETTEVGILALRLR